MKEKKKHHRDKPHAEGGRHREDSRQPKERGHHHGERRHGAKTFRRGRAIEFLDRLNVKQATLKQQLETPELQTINQILVGELKAVEAIIGEFTQLFEIHEDELKRNDSVEKEKGK